MKALIYKDLLSLWKYLRTYLVLCALFQLMSLVNDSSFLRFYPTILVATIPNTLLAYEERDKWDRLSLTLPVSRKTLVTAKYLVGLILLGGITLLSAATGLIHVMNDPEADLTGLFLELSGSAALGLFVQSIVLPATFRLGAEKGRLVYGFCLGIAAVLFLLGVFTVSAVSAQAPLFSLLVSILIPALLLMMLAASWLLSVRFYEKREF